MSLVLAIDGHDGSGKTTLAKRLAAHLDAVYVRPYDKPTGEQFLDAAENGAHDVAWSIAETAVANILQIHHDARAIVFDRCWLTVFTVVPERFFHRWKYSMPTALCWCDLDTTLDRLSKRKEQHHPLSWHQHYIRLYRNLAKRMDCTIVNTNQLSIDESLIQLINWEENIFAK